MIEFIFEESRPGRRPVFGDVENEQFFIATDGYLCQKVGQNKYHTIAGEQGQPFASRELVIRPGVPIERVLPRVAKIKFPGVQE